MGFAILCFRRSASRLASSVCGGRVRSISTVVKRPSLVHNPSLLRDPFVSRGFLFSTVATDDDWISSEQAVLRAIDSEYHNPPHNDLDPFESFYMALWKDRSIGFKNLPASFPFKVEDIPGNRTVTMTREYNGEHIKVVGSMLMILPNDDGGTNGSEDDATSNKSKDDDATSNKSKDDAPNNESKDYAPGNESNDDDDEDDEPSPHDCPVVVTITKKSGHSLELHCKVSSDEITINDIHVYLPGHSSEDPKIILDMNDSVGFEHKDLKESLIKYLKVRGLDASSIHGYMVGKMKQEYWLWLDYVKEFFEK